MIAGFEMKRLPKSYSKGAKKAYRNFQEEYGEEEGTRIFVAKANEQGVGDNLRARVNSVFATGAKPSLRRRG